jgi:hypothetical protein
VQYRKRTPPAEDHEKKPLTNPTEGERLAFESTEIRQTGSRSGQDLIEL